MGFAASTAGALAARHAAQAREQGRHVFVYRQAVRALATRFSGPVDGVAEVIEAVESQGWSLQDMAFDPKQSRHGGVVLVFRPYR